MSNYLNKKFKKQKKQNEKEYATFAFHLNLLD